MDFLDISHHLTYAKKYQLNITLKHDDIKGTGLFAIRDINENEIIAHYKLKICNSKNYISPLDFRYSFAIFSRSGHSLEHLIGDIDDNCFPMPIDNIPFWGPFVNEPSGKQHINACFNPNLKYNYKKYNRRGFKIGDTVIYSICSIRPINTGEEITVYYGEDYSRDYKINLSDDDKQKCVYNNLKSLK